MNIENIKIVLVEDELLIAKAQKNELEAMNYDVTICKSGFNAIEHIVHNKSECDLVLMDINLGKGIDGIQTAVHINKSVKIPIIFLSSNRQILNDVSMKETNCYGYILKNCGATVLNFYIQSALKRSKSNKDHDYLLYQTNEVSNIYQLFVSISTDLLRNSNFRNDIISITEY